MSSSSIPSLGISQSLLARKTTRDYSYRHCPICDERLLVRIGGSFVQKWINIHFAAKHHEWMHIVVNMNERQTVPLLKKNNRHARTAFALSLSR